MSTAPRCPECSGLHGLPRLIFSDDEPRECTNEFHKQPAPIVVEDPPPAAPEAPATPTPPRSPIPKPICPYCSAEGSIFGQMTSLGDFQVMVVRCGNNDCRKILFGFQALQMQMVPPLNIN